MIIDLRSNLIENLSGGLGQTLLSFLKRIGYQDWVYSNYKKPQTAQKKWRSVETLSGILDKFVKNAGFKKAGIIKFLDSMTLREEVNSDDVNKDQVQLMTLHACKGLEFPVVILIGCEEDIIPHKLLGTDVNEERRLFYVGLTRAKKHLVLTSSQTRKRFGKKQMVTPSRFLLEIPKELVKEYVDGVRPLRVEERKNMLEDLYKKLDMKIENFDQNLSLIHI